MSGPGRHPALTVAIVPLALCVLSASASAQTAVCPHAGDICFVTGGGCGPGQAQIWEEDLCGCHPERRFYYINCWGEGSSTNQSCGGGPGNDCTFFPCYAEPVYEHVCPVPDAEVPEPDGGDPDESPPLPPRPCPRGESR